ncbi:bile acid:sodium symporter [Nanchangia anserum]|uniref:Bile acid:sodium symporter n=1 Tax=Nanchangia anserum TaxID=2692125 RepID=A0A8I0G9J1_9ACTO|nr:bile acid:sodium symporter [Nanchangia anserum]
MSASRLRDLADPFIITLLLIVAAGILIPAPAALIGAFTWAGKVAVMVLFLVYGARLATRDVVEGLTNLRLQGAVAAATFLVFPLLGWATYVPHKLVLGPMFALGTLYLTLLPSTVQSSVSFTSIARGNIAGAVCSATVSNIAGVVLTPALVYLIMGRASGVDPSRILNVVAQLLVPFVIGQLLQPRVGDWVRSKRWLTKGVDHGTILLVVASAVCGATAQGLWHTVTWAQVLGLLASSAIILAIMLALTWWGGKVLGLNRGDRIVLLMCGSKKSLATGLPMASIIFPATTLAAVTVPVIVFHQLQLVVCAILARRLARAG